MLLLFYVLIACYMVSIGMFGQVKDIMLDMW